MQRNTQWTQEKKMVPDGGGDGFTVVKNKDTKRALSTLFHWQLAFLSLLHLH